MNIYPYIFWRENEGRLGVGGLVNKYDNLFES